MTRVLVLAEGPTEEAFIKTVLAPHLATFGKWLQVTCVCTRREKGRRAFRGGGSSYPKIQRDLRELLRSRPDAVTTMLDYYGLPGDFPGLASLPTGGTCFDRAAHLEAAFASDIADARFIPNLVLHEFEGLLFSSPRVIAEVLLDPARVGALEDIAGEAPTPEEINDGPSTHPSKQLEALFSKPKSYQKPLDGPRIASRIGLSRIREVCKHFNAWLERLEAL